MMFQSTTTSTGPATAIFIALSLSFSLISCGNDTVDGPDFAFPSGDFIISTHFVDDRCLDGGLNLLFMPRGEDEPWEWPFPVQVQAPEELPKTYMISLREPFHEMTVTATQVHSDEQQFVAQTNPSVKLGPDRFGECVVALDGVVNLKLVDTDRVEGIAALQMRDPRGDDRCPVDMPPTCDVILSFDGTRSSAH
ncbi:MAG: hypothetical protein ACNA8W_12130 [Bradymonadaceae bacterium]